MDGERIARIADGDRQAFEDLYREYQPRLYRYLARIAGEAPAGELANDVMVEVWKSAGSFRGEANVSTWIFGIAHYKALNEFRRTRRDQVELEDAGPLADTAANPQQRFEQRDREACLKRALQRLSPEHREAMQLTYYAGFSYEEIAEVMRCPVNTVKTRMFYARRQLKEFLAEEGIGREDL